MNKMPADFSGAMKRIYEGTGTNTQVELAEILTIRQSSISDAKRRGSIPDGWLVSLFDKFRLNPDWIRTGTGPHILTDAGESLAIHSKATQQQSVYKRAVVFSAARKESDARKSGCHIRKGEMCLGSECMAFGRAIGDASADYFGMCLALPNVQVPGVVVD